MPSAVHLLAIIAAVGPLQTPERVSFHQAVRRAVTNTPRVRACSAELDAAQARVDETRASTYPSLVVGAQLNRGTGNVVPGSAFAMTGVPALSGPPRGDTFDTGTWTTIASLTTSFELTRFVAGMRELDASLSRYHGEQARLEQCKLDAAYDAAVAFLDVTALTAAMQALAADRERASALLSRTRALVEATLRPGAELAQAEAELAAVDTRLAGARRDTRVAQERLAEALGRTPAPDIDAELPDITPDMNAIADHPKRAFAEGYVRAAEYSRDATRWRYYPRIELAAALWARGSAYDDPQLGASRSGLVPDVGNWTAGVIVAWDILDLAETRARSRRADADTTASVAMRDASILALETQLAQARASLEEARTVLGQTAAAVTAARVASDQAQARYSSGLSALFDVVRVRELLVNSELTDIAARISVTRAQVALARAVGDITALLGASSGGR